jgi:hypothetical protein
MMMADMGVWQGVAMHPIGIASAHHAQPFNTLYPYPAPLKRPYISGVASPQGGRPAAVLYPFGPPRRAPVIAVASVVKAGLNWFRSGQ